MRKFVGRLEAIVRVLLHTLEDDAFKRCVNLGVALAWWHGLLVDLLERDRDRVIAIKGNGTRRGLVHHDAKRVDVGRGAKLLALRLLGRDVVGGSQDGVIGGQVAVLGTCDAKVHDLDVAIWLHHDVLRLDVAMDDVMSVGDREGLGYLRANLRDLLAVKGTVLAYAALEVGAA